MRIRNILCNSLLIITILSSFTACGKEELVRKTISIPNWYINAKNNNTEFIYGTGQGDTIEEAKNNALNNMAASLMVNVKSSFNQKKHSSSDGFYSNNVSKEIEVKVEKMKFTNVIIEKNILIDFTYYLLVKVNKSKLFTDKKQEFDINDKRIEIMFKSLNKFSLFEQIIKLQKYKQEIVDNKKRAYILYVINNKYKYSLIAKRYDEYLSKIDTLKNKITITVSSNEKSGYFKDELISLLNSNNFNISNNKNSDLKIIIKNKVRKSIARDWKITKITTTLSVYVNNKIMSNKIINTIGRSTSSNENSLQNASSSFSNKITSIGINEIIFRK